MPVASASFRSLTESDLRRSEELDSHYDDPIRTHAVDELPDWALEMDSFMYSDALLNASPAGIKRLGDRLKLPEYTLTFGQAGDIIASIADNASPFGHVAPFSILHDGGLKDDSDSDDSSLELPRITVADEAEYIQAVHEEDAAPNEDKENDGSEGSGSDDIEEEDVKGDDSSDEYVASEDDEDADYQPYRPTRRNAARRDRSLHRAVCPPLSPIKGGENHVVQTGKKRRRHSSSPSRSDYKRAKASNEDTTTPISATKAAARLKRYYKRDKALQKVAESLPRLELSNGSVQCQVADCGKLLSKGAWWRHAHTHLKGFVAAFCLACGRTFTRTDPLCRHLATNHVQCIEQRLGTDEHVESCCKPLHEYRSKKAGLEQGRGLHKLSKGELRKAVQCLAALE
ncbi:hypothetical protein EV715DRAFT_293497 [Schizophyllum commune]